MPATPETDDLDLPPLDGEGEDAEAGVAAHAEEELDADPADGTHDPLDDSTGESDPLEEIAVEGTEGGWLVDAEDAGGLDVGPFEVSLGGEESVLDHEEPEALVPDEELGAGEDVAHVDGGEEGPLAEDEELREEDLPALDADEDGDVEEDSLYDRSLLGHDEELRWDDRAWARVHDDTPADGDEADDSGVLAVPGDDPRYSGRDAMWRQLDDGGRLTAAALVPGESVVVALESPERPVIVRIHADGSARIIAEIETGAAEDEAAAVRVTALRWDAGRGYLVVTGTFGVQVFRPA